MLLFCAVVICVDIRSTKGSRWPEALFSVSEDAYSLWSFRTGVWRRVHAGASVQGWKGP
jgi:hypothetical protein